MCFSMYSDMSRRTMLASSSNRNSANARPNSVLPTPVGPRKMNEPMGRLGSLSPDRARTTASATADTASSWPMSRLCRCSPRCSSFSRSPSNSLDTGTPVQRDTTSAMSSSSTSSLSRTPPSSVLRPSSCLASSPSSWLSLPYLSSAKRLRSYSRSACSMARRVSSISSLSLRSRAMASFSISQRALSLLASSLRLASSFSSLAKRSRDALSFSLRRASRSISSCMTWREAWSSSVGMESISVRSLEPASSIKSMALSGRKRSVM